MTFKFSKTSIERMDGVNPDLIALTHRALSISIIDFGIPRYGGLRTPDIQKRLFNDGKSQCDGVNNKSYHQSGNAIDFYAYVDNKASWDKGHLGLVAAAFFQAANELKVNIEWGGFWKWRDMPHIQLINHS